MILFQMESYQTTQKFLVITYINSHWSPQMQSNIENVASDLTLHWIYCNVYTVCAKSVQKKIEKLVQKYHFLKRYTIMKRKMDYWEEFSSFISHLPILKETAAIFRLKSGGKNLLTEDYDLNLSSYYDSAKACSSLTICDLNNVSTGLKSEHFYII